ncbi:MAG: tetratricopeptide repeat protein, partial [Pseudomonadota bacterium]
EIRNLEAQLLYLDICTLHRFDCPVRAGMISRLSNITFEDFRDRFMQPLEKVVEAFQDYKIGDFVYRTRHPEIASFVFERALETEAQRATQLARMLQYLNPEYSVDGKALEHILKGRRLAEVFADKALVHQLFTTAESVGIDPAFVWHQRAVFELHHRGSDLRSALSSINKALELANKDYTSLKHTKANIYRRLAKETKDAQEREEYHSRAKEVLSPLTKTARDSYPVTLLVEVMIDELECNLGLGANEEAREEPNEERPALPLLMHEIKSKLDENTVKFPHDVHLLKASARFSKVLSKFPESKSILEKASKIDPGNGQIAVLLARALSKAGQLGDAKAILTNCNKVRGTQVEVHFELAMLLIREDEEKNDEAIYHHLKRSFKSGDTRYRSRFELARFCYLHGRIDEAKKLFGELRKCKASPHEKSRVRHVVKGQSRDNAQFRGTIESVKPGYCWIRSYEFDETIFAHSSAFENDKKMKTGSGVTMTMAFTYKGPQAKSVA